MSAIIGRFLLTAGLGLVAAIVYTIVDNNRNRREQHSHRSRSGNRTVHAEYEYRSDGGSWGGGISDDDQPRRARSNDSFHSAQEDVDDTSKNGSPRKRREEVDPDVQNTCPVCLETFANLKKRKIPIYTTACGHIHCERCVRGSVQSNSKCSLCRKPIVMERCTRLFF